MSEIMVSVIIPVYNKEQYLPRCVDSVLSQTFQDIEIILVDDESTDRSGDIAEEYALRDKRVRVIHQKNKGDVGARRSGIAAASGEYLTFLDADDEFPPNAVETLYKYCVGNNLDIVFGAHKRIIGDREFCVYHPFERILSGDELCAYLMDLRSVCLSSNFSRRSIWRNEVFVEGDKKYPNGDVLINIKLSRYVNRAGVINDVVYYYYYVPTSLSGAGVLWTQPLWKENFRLLKTELEERGLYEDNRLRFQILEIDRLAFNLKKVDKSDEWVKQVLNYDLSQSPIKTKVLQKLLHCPSLLRFAILLNRYLKSLFGKLKN